MLSPEERWLIAGILALLLVGGGVKMCRQQVVEKDVEKVHLSGVAAPAPSKPSDKEKASSR